MMTVASLVDPMVVHLEFRMVKKKVDMMAGLMDSWVAVLWVASTVYSSDVKLIVCWVHHLAAL
jgi:phage-related minor tail protein